jgi:hypothetical protein
MANLKYRIPSHNYRIPSKEEIEEYGRAYYRTNTSWNEKGITDVLNGDMHNQSALYQLWIACIQRDELDVKVNALQSLLEWTSI